MLPEPLAVRASEGSDWVCSYKADPFLGHLRVRVSNVACCTEDAGARHVGGSLGFNLAEDAVRFIAERGQAVDSEMRLGVAAGLGCTGWWRRQRRRW